jgi:hypothetical protein
MFFARGSRAAEQASFSSDDDPATRRYASLGVGASISTVTSASLTSSRRQAAEESQGEPQHQRRGYRPGLGHALREGPRQLNGSERPPPAHRSPAAADITTSPIR